ncbi:MAG: hypothetical protein ACRENN_04955 [Candidatus Eiseniibacteriota bacterium]
MRFSLVAILSIALLAPHAGAAPAHQPVSLAILYPVSTNQDPDISTNLRLSLFYGRVGEVRGIDLNGVVSETSGDVSGIQLNGVYGQVGGDMKGVQWTGAVSYVKGNTAGLQIAYLGLVDEGDLNGVQFGGLFNMVNGSVYGLQAAGAVNLVDGNASFVQWSAFGNSVAGDFTGLQTSGGFNYVGGRMGGIQGALVNFTGRMAGLQVGGANFARTAAGLQVGVANWAREQKGIPVGLVNLAEGGEIDWVTYGSNLCPFNTGIRTEVRNWYSMLTAGTHDSKGDVKDALILTWNYGRAFPLAKRTRLGLDLGFSHYIPAKDPDPAKNDVLHYAIEARGLLERRTGQRTLIFAGGGYARVFSAYTADATGENEPLVFGGVSLF